MKKPDFSNERKFWRKYQYLIGIDEVGRGALAGPIIAAGVVFPQIMRITKKSRFLRRINDSKKLKALERRRLSKMIIRYSLFFAIEEVGVEIINKLGIGKANHLVIKKVAEKISKSLGNKTSHILCDGLPIPKLENHTAIVDGDCKSVSIAAASIIAKVHRDNLMRNYSKKFHHYKFARNKGYGTKFHQKAIHKYGLTEIHRTSFELTKFLSQ